MAIQSGGIKRIHVIKAAEKWRRHPGYGGFRHSTHYDVVIKDERFPPKAIVAIANELAGERRLRPSDFAGAWDGKWHRELKRLGFEIHAKGDRVAVSPAPIPISASELVDLITELDASIVITKNKNRSAEKNFHVDPANPNQWLNGKWPGLPVRIKPERAFVLHWQVQKSLIWIGRYKGTMPADGRSNFLVLDKAHLYQITDMTGDTGAHALLRRILKQNGPVTYSYYRPEQPIPGETPEQRFQHAQARLEQPAFRDAVLAHYDNQCIVTKCTTLNLLDAAHLPGRDWRLGHNRVSDGIPLRSDVHRALDHGLIRLDSRHRLVWASPDLNGMYDDFLVARPLTKRA